MKMMKKAAAITVVLCFLFGCTGALAEMPGTWIVIDETEEREQGMGALCQYIFCEDGTYEYADLAIGYREYGIYMVDGSRLLLIRSDGGMEEYELTADEWVFRGIDEDDEQMFARKNTHSMAASIETR